MYLNKFFFVINIIFCTDVIKMVSIYSTSILILLILNLFTDARRILIFTSGSNYNSNMTEFLKSYDFRILAMRIDVHEVS